jgi:hypothetical protein
VPTRANNPANIIVRMFVSLSGQMGAIGEVVATIAPSEHPAAALMLAGERAGCFQKDLPTAVRPL